MEFLTRKYFICSSCLSLHASYKALTAYVYKKGFCADQTVNISIKLSTLSPIVIVSKFPSQKNKDKNQHLSQVLFKCLDTYWRSLPVQPAATYVHQKPSLDILMKLAAIYNSASMNTNTPLDILNQPDIFCLTLIALSLGKPLPQFIPTWLKRRTCITKELLANHGPVLDEQEQVSTFSFPLWQLHITMNSAQYVWLSFEIHT